MTDQSQNTTEDLLRFKREQHDLWNGDMGDIWVAEQAFIDGMIKPFEKLLVDAARATHPGSVLDVGCGNGTTTLAMARALPHGARLTGLDLSQQMITNAKKRSDHEDLAVDFICADAADYAFARETFDLITSRFGVMFFADPVAAFQNLRGAASRSCRGLFLVWRRPEDNAFMMTGQKAASAYLPQGAPKPMDAPGPFSLADPDRVSAVLKESGWSDPQFEAVDLTCCFPSCDLDMFLEKLAPIGPGFNDLNADLKDKVRRIVRDAYAPFITGGEVEFIASCWLIKTST
ncbi:MAG: class I SAM-dependent methyltransferase [Pseudomonadota bacterium]